MQNSPPESCDIHRRADGTLLVRVHSRERNGRKAPDAVFTFRVGDPQYEYWAKQLGARQTVQEAR